MLPTPDPDQASWLAKASAAVAGFAATCWGVIRLLNKKDADVVKGHGESIDELRRNQRSDKIEMNSLIHERANQLGEQIAGLADTQRLNREAILEAIRDDHRATGTQLHALAQGFADFREHVAEELGRRPTREELAAGVLFQGAKKNGSTG